MDAQTVQQRLEALRHAAARVVLGQHEAIDGFLLALGAGGHILLEGVPGLAKTLLARTMAGLIGGRFRRVQFTPDLMPADLLGTRVFDPRDVSFHLVQGPVFTDVLLADEINRTPPKTQAALLEAMQERQVTLDNETHPLGSRFMVVATQNPIEFEGTYPLPEAQTDRFFLKLLLSYPTVDDERQLLRHSLTDEEQPGETEAVLDEETLTVFRRLARAVHVEDDVITYVSELISATRKHPSLLLGVSPRGAVALLHAAQVAAVIAGRDYATPDDVKTVWLPLCRHRVIVAPEARAEGLNADSLLERIGRQVPVPR